MNIARVLFSICCLCLVAAPAGYYRAAAQDTNKLVYADFETLNENRVVSNRGGVVQLFGYQERQTVMSRFKGQEGSNPPAPEVVRLKKDDPNRAIAFDYEIQAPNQYAGVGVEIFAQAANEGKPVALDVSGYKHLALQLYATGVDTIKVEFITRGQGISTPDAHPQSAFIVKSGFNTYQVPLKSLSQPSWANVKVTPKDVLKKLTSINVVAYCDQCTPTKGTVVIDNIVFQN
jgi:hypothetical protein